MPTSTQRFRLVGEDDASKAFLEVAAASRLLKSSMDDVSSSALGLGKLVGGTGLIPIFAAASAATLELNTSLGAAAGAGGVFGLSVVGQIKSMVEQRKAITQTETSLSKLTKGTDQYADTLVSLHQKQAAFNQQFGPAAKGLDEMSGSWAEFLDKTAPVTNGALAKGFDLVSDALPKLVPVSNAAGQAVGGLIDDLDGWVEGPGFAHLLHFLETSGPKDITAFGHSIGNVLGGLGGILSNFVGPGDHAAASLEHLTASFDKWGHSKGVSQGVDSFLRYVGDNGPEISTAFESLAKASPKIASSLGDLGSLNLSLTSKFLDLIAGMPQKQFDIVVTGLFGIAAASKAITIATAGGALFKGLAGIAGGKGLGKGIAGGVLGSSGGVQKVFVVNPGFGGGDGGPGGLLKKGAPFLAAGTTGGTVAGIAAITAVAAGSAFVLWKSWQGESQPGRAPNVAGMTPLETQRFNAERINNNGIGPAQIPEPAQIKASTTAFQAMGAAAAGASRQIDLIGPHAKVSGGVAVKTVETLNGKMAAISGGKGSAAFDLIGNSASKNTATAGKDTDNLSGKIRNIPNRDVKISANTAGAQASVQALINAIGQVHDKSFTITRYTNATTAEHTKPGSPPPPPPPKSSSDKAPVIINVNAPVGSDPYTIGEQLQQYLDAYAGSPT